MHTILSILFLLMILFSMCMNIFSFYAVFNIYKHIYTYYKNNGNTLSPSTLFFFLFATLLDTAATILLIFNMYLFKNGLFELLISNTSAL